MGRDLSTRKKIRLQGHDYAQAGYYFVTICVKDRHEMLWEHAPVGARIARPLSPIGEVVKNTIENISVVYRAVCVDKYVVMPNHIHMIIRIENSGQRVDKGHGRAMRAPTISTVVNQFKGYATKQIGFSIWQKLFHDHIIRSEAEYQKIWRYIDENPANWQDDCYFTK